MRIGVIADIHGNAVALDAVLADLEVSSVDSVVCLGDVVQGGPQPAEVLARLRGLGCPVVRGNADAWLLSGRETGTAETVTDAQEAVRAWSLTQLEPADVVSIESFAPLLEIPLEGGRRLVCFHGSPASFDDVILPETPEADFVRLLGGYTGAVLTGGHTHLQQIRRLGDGFFFNPGSVGLAYDRNQPEAGFQADPWAEYAILTSAGDRLGLEFRRVHFAVDAFLRALAASGRPDAETMIAQYGGRPA